MHTLNGGVFKALSDMWDLALLGMFWKSQSEVTEQFIAFFESVVAGIGLAWIRTNVPHIPAKTWTVSFWIISEILGLFSLTLLDFCSKLHSIDHLKILPQLSAVIIASGLGEQQIL